VAILTIAVADGQPGVYRVLDAFIGVGVALVFTQLLFSPEPVALVRRAEVAALALLAEALDLAATSLEHDDEEPAERAVSGLRDRPEQPEQLTELSRVRRVAGRVARRSVIWRRRRAPVVREVENAGHLDLLWGSCLMLARAVRATSGTDRRPPASSVRDVARVLADLAQAIGDRAVRQRAADCAVDVGRRSVDGDGAAAVALRMVAADVVVFAGVDPSEAVAAIRDGTQPVAPSAAASVADAPARPGRWRAGRVTGLATVGAVAYWALRRRRRG